VFLGLFLSIYTCLHAVVVRRVGGEVSFVEEAAARFSPDNHFVSGEIVIVHDEDGAPRYAQISSDERVTPLEGHQYLVYMLDPQKNSYIDYVETSKLGQIPNEALTGLKAGVSRGILRSQK